MNEAAGESRVEPQTWILATEIRHESNRAHLSFFNILTIDPVQESARPSSQGLMLSPLLFLFPGTFSGWLLMFPLRLRPKLNNNHVKR